MIHAIASEIAEDEVRLMADVLQRKYGAGARGLAMAFAFEHRAVGDETRAGHWDRVGAELGARSPQRTLS